MRRLCIISLLFVLTLCIASIAGAEVDGEPITQIKVGMECDFAPNNWQEDVPTEFNMPITNNPGFYADGYDVKIAQIIASKLGTDLAVLKISWGKLIEALKSGEIDMIIAGMADTAERRRAVLFSEPYLETEYAMVVRSDSKYVTAESLDDFAGAGVLAQKGTKLDEVIDQIEDVNHLLPVDTVPLEFEELAQSKCDAIVVNYQNVLDDVAVHPEFKVIRFAPYKGFILDISGACVALRKGSINLLRQVNNALDDITGDERDKLFQEAMDRQPK